MIVCSVTFLAMYNLRLKSKKVCSGLFLATKTCFTKGSVSEAIRPGIERFTGAFLQPSNLSPCFLIFSSKVEIQKSRWFCFCGKKILPTAYSPASGNSKSQTAWKKSWGTSIKIPAPSPVLPSALTAPLCSKRSRISNAL